MLTISQKRQRLVEFELEWLRSVGDVANDTDIDQTMRYIDKLYTEYSDIRIEHQYSLKFED